MSSSRRAADRSSTSNSNTNTASFRQREAPGAIKNESLNKRLTRMSNAQTEADLEIDRLNDRVNQLEIDNKFAMDLLRCLFPDEWNIRTLAGKKFIDLSPAQQAMVKASDGNILCHPSHLPTPTKPVSSHGGSVFGNFPTNHTGFGDQAFNAGHHHQTTGQLPTLVQFKPSSAPPTNRSSGSGGSKSSTNLAETNGSNLIYKLVVQDQSSTGLGVAKDVAEVQVQTDQQAQIETRNIDEQ